MEENNKQTVEMTAEEMAGAFSALENGGVYREPDCIVRMENLAGEDIYTGREPKEVYSQQTAAVMVDVMKALYRGEPPGEWAGRAGLRRPERREPPTTARTAGSAE